MRIVGRGALAAPFLFLAACVTTVVEAPPPRPVKPEAKPGRPEEALLEFVAHAVEQYRSHSGEYPRTLDDLRSQPPDVVKWFGPYIEGPAVDAWNRPILYSRTPTGYELRSAGPDGVPNTADDVAITRP